MTRKCRRPSRTKSQLQAQAEEDGASVDGAEPRADVEAVKAEVEATEQNHLQKPTNPKKNLCGAQKKKLKGAKLEKARNAPTLLTIPRELRQNILHFIYNEETTRGLSRFMRDIGQCSRFAPLPDKVYQYALSKARNDSAKARLLFDELNNIKPALCRCFNEYVREVGKDEKKLADWVLALKLIHPGLIEDADFVAGKWREEVLHTLFTEKHGMK